MYIYIYIYTYYYTQFYIWIGGWNIGCEDDQKDLTRVDDEKQDSLMSKKPKEIEVKERRWSIM